MDADLFAQALQAADNPAGQVPPVSGPSPFPAPEPRSSPVPTPTRQPQQQQLQRRNPNPLADALGGGDTGSSITAQTQPIEGASSPKDNGRKIAQLRERYSAVAQQLPLPVARMGLMRFEQVAAQAETGDRKARKRLKSLVREAETEFREFQAAQLGGRPTGRPAMPFPPFSAFSPYGGRWF